MMGMNPADFLPAMETDWIASATPSSAAPSPLRTKKAAYKIIGNAVCPPVIAWLAEKVVLPAGGFIKKKGRAGRSLPVYLRLALEAVKEA